MSLRHIVADECLFDREEALYLVCSPGMQIRKSVPLCEKALIRYYLAQDRGW